MSTKSTPGVRENPTPRQVYYNGREYGLNNNNGDNCGNWFLWIVGIGLFAFLILAIVLNFTATPSHYHAIVVQSAENSIVPGPSESPFVFKLYNFAEKRTRRSLCVTGEFWNEEVGMCAPVLKLPNLYDSSIVDGTVSPCTSFFNNMCGRWISEHTNEDRSFSFAYHRNKRLIEKLILKADAETDPVGKLYASCIASESHQSMAESRIEWTHIQESIVGQLRGYGDLPVVFAKLARHGFTSPFAFSMERHPLEPRIVPLITWDGVLNASLVTVTQVFESSRHITQHGDGLLLNKIERAWKVIHALDAHNTEPIEEIVDYVDYLQTGFANDTLPYSMLPQWHTPYAEASGWRRFFEAYGGFGLQFPREQLFWVIGKPYLHWLMTQAVPKMEIMDWKAYVEFCILYNTHQFTPSLPHNVYFKRWDTQGPVGPESRIYHRIPRANTTHAPYHERDCVEIVRHLLPGHVAKSYLEAALPDKEQVRQEIRDMIVKIIAQYKQAVLATDWLPMADRQIAVEKIESILIRVAEPDEWEPEPFASVLHRERWDHNLNAIRRYRVERNLQLWHRDMPNGMDRNALAFFSSPLSTVNAYYSGPTNTITILAGILQIPFYNGGYSNVAKYAVLGSVVAHELGHALDPHGVHWDKDGSYKVRGIWSETGMSGLYRALQPVIGEFGPTPAGCNATGLVYGNHTLGEDMSDLGIGMAYRAYFEETPSASLNDKQRFFMAFAQIWCSSYDMNHTCAAVLYDVHAVPQYRVDHTLRNLPEFQQAFSCREDMAMYRAKANQVKVYG